MKLLRFAVLLIIGPSHSGKTEFARSLFKLALTLRIGALKQGTEAVGNKTRVRVVKNKLAPPFRQAEFEIVFGRGISRAGEALDAGLENGFISRAGSWFSYEGTSIGQGREAARAWLEENPTQLAALVQVLESGDDT